MQVNDVYRVKIEGYDIQGFGIAHIENRVIFIEGAMADEDILCEIVNVHKKYAFGIAKEIYKKSIDRIEPLCPYAKVCGGCDLLHMRYDVEKKIKENKVFQTLKRREDIIYNPIIEADEIYGYRNKVMVPFGKTKDVICGFFEKRSHRIIPMEKCIISSDVDNEILNEIKKYLNETGLSIYDEESHSGIFREVMIRHTSLNEYMVILVATQNHDFKDLVEILTNKFKQIKSLYLNINPDKTNVVLSNTFKLLYGKQTVTERILNLDFEVSPSSFLQVNHKQCEKLYTEALRMANITKDNNVIDAYCGMGSISLNIAKQANMVYGIEVVPSAIENANENKKRNNITNATFICGKCEDEIIKLVNKENIDTIFFDPPRKGCDEKFLDVVVQMQIPKIIYISCNVATLARDVEYLEKRGYQLKEVTPVDLFSRTSHIESVCQLVLRDEAK